MIRASGLGLLLLFLALVSFDQRHAVVAMFGEAVLLTFTFTLLALLAGWFSGSLLHLNQNDRAVLAIEFGVRNVGIAALSAGDGPAATVRPAPPGARCGRMPPAQT